MEILKNNFFLNHNKMENELKKLIKLEGKIFQAIEAITAKKRKGKGWFAKALSKAYKLVKSMGYNIPYGRSKQYADDLVNIYFMQKQSLVQCDVGLLGLCDKDVTGSHYQDLGYVSMLRDGAIYHVILLMMILLLKWLHIT